MSLILVFFIIAGCQSKAAIEPQGPTLDGDRKTYQNLVVGFSQIGDESEWRTGNTASIKEEAEYLGVELLFSDAQQKQENQIKAIRTFIAQQVDVIGVSPIVGIDYRMPVYHILCSIISNISMGNHPFFLCLAFIQFSSIREIHDSPVFKGQLSLEFYLYGLESYFSDTTYCLANRASSCIFGMDGIYFGWRFGTVTPGKISLLLFPIR